MKGSSLPALVWFLTSCAALFPTSAVAQVKHSAAPVVQYTSKLGLDAKVPIDHVLVPNDDLLSWYVAWGKRAEGKAVPQLLLESSPAVFIAIPLSVFRKAELKDGAHVVTLASGRELKGKFACSVRTGHTPFELPSEDDQEYDLRAATRLAWVSSPPKSSGKQPPRKSGQSWELRLADGATHSVADPRFAYRYSSSVGYVTGSSDHTSTDASFLVKTGGEEIATNLTDFESVVFEKREGTDIVQLKSKSGVDTSGELILKAEDSRGSHRAFKWMVFADLVDMGGLSVAVTAPPFRLSKVAKK